MDENIRRRLHISGMDSRAAELARRYGLGVEITELAYAPMLDRPGMAEELRRKNEGVRSLWLHAPFAELCPCAIDPLVREVALRRYRQTLAAAQVLGAGWWCMAGLSRWCISLSGMWSSRCSSGGNFCRRSPTALP